MRQYQLKQNINRIKAKCLRNTNRIGLKQNHTHTNQINKARKTIIGE